MVSVLIVAEENDAHVLTVEHSLRQVYGCAPAILSMSRFPTHLEAVFECGSAPVPLVTRAGEVDLASVDVVWWRRPNHATVSNDFFAFDRDFLQIECDHFLQGLLWSADCPWINHPTNEIHASRKLVQLARAAKLGLNIPRTMVTNSVAEAERFVESVGKAIATKRIGTSPGQATKTTVLTSDELCRLQTVVACPTTFQEYIEPGGDIRALVAGNSVYAFWIDTASSASADDSRLDLTVEHRAHKLSDNLERQLVALLDVLDLTLGVVDLRVSPTGEIFFLEVNPSGQYLHLELLTGVNLSGHVAKLIYDTARTHN